MAWFEVRALAGSGWGPVDLSLAVGDCLGISGPSGVGKTRLLRGIADLDQHRGEVILDGQAQTAISGPDWRRQVAYLPAEPAWWGVHAGEHFAESPVAQLAELNLPESLLQQPIERLSSGERQRLAILRLLEQRPRILLLDEPTANLDDTNTRAVEQMIRRYLATQEAAAIWVSHDADQLQRLCNHRYQLTADGITGA